MASKDREWFYQVDLRSKNEELMAGNVQDDAIMQIATSASTVGTDGRLYKLTDADRTLAKAYPSLYDTYRNAFGTEASEQIFKTAINVGGFVETRVLAYYMGMGAGNELVASDGDGMSRMPMLHFLSLYPDIPASALRLYLGFGRRYPGRRHRSRPDEEALLTIDGGIDVSYTDLLYGDTALHCAVRSLDLAPMYSSDEYITENALDKIRILLQHGAKPDMPNRDLITPFELVQMLENQWNTPRGKDIRWKTKNWTSDDPDDLIKTEGAFVRPRHVATPLVARKAYQLMKDALDAQTIAKVRFKVDDNDPLESAIVNFKWAEVEKHVRAKERESVKDSKWLVSTNNFRGLPMIWLFLAAMTALADRLPFRKAVLPVDLFERILTFYYKYPPNPDTRNEELEQIFWYCVGASNYFGNDVDPENDSLPRVLYDGSNIPNYGPIDPSNNNNQPPPAIFATPKTEWKKETLSIALDNDENPYFYALPSEDDTPSDDEDAVSAMGDDKFGKQAPSSNEKMLKLLDSARSAKEFVDYLMYYGTLFVRSLHKKEDGQSLKGKGKAQPSVKPEVKSEHFDYDGKHLDKDDREQLAAALATILSGIDEKKLEAVYYEVIEPANGNSKMASTYAKYTSERLIPRDKTASKKKSTPEKLVSSWIQEAFDVFIDELPKMNRTFNEIKIKKDETSKNVQNFRPHVTKVENLGSRIGAKAKFIGALSREDIATLVVLHDKHKKFDLNEPDSNEYNRLMIKAQKEGRTDLVDDDWNDSAENQNYLQEAQAWYERSRAPGSSIQTSNNRQNPPPPPPPGGGEGGDDNGNSSFDVKDDDDGDTSRTEFNKVRNYPRFFFPTVLGHSVFREEVNSEQTGVLKNKSRHHFAIQSKIGSAIHQAMRKGDFYSLNAIASSRAARELGDLDIRHPETKRTPIQTAISAGHSKDTISRLYSTLFQKRQQQQQ